MKTGKSYAKDVWATTSRALTNYARAWTDMYKETCEATAVHKVQSTEVLDLRMACLNERLGGLRALTDVFAEANGEVVENAVSASNALASLDRCADVPLLRAVVKPPEDAATRARVEELRKRLAELKARFDAGNYRDAVKVASAVVADARVVAYQPLVAESLTLLGTVAYKSDAAALAQRALRRRHFSSAKLRATMRSVRRPPPFSCSSLDINYGTSTTAIKWAKLADAVIQRLGGHDLLRAWLLNDLGTVYASEGQNENAARTFRESIRLKEKVLGIGHPDVDVSEGNLAITLAEHWVVRRGVEARRSSDRNDGEGARCYPS